MIDYLRVLALTTLILGVIAVFLDPELGVGLLIASVATSLLAREWGRKP